MADSTRSRAKPLDHASNIDARIPSRRRTFSKRVDGRTKGLLDTTRDGPSSTSTVADSLVDRAAVVALQPKLRKLLREI